MRPSTPVPFLFLPVLAAIGCGGVPFETLPEDAAGLEGDGGAETSTTGPDATVDEGGERPDATNDVAAGPDGPTDATTPIDSPSPSDAADNCPTTPDTVHGVFVSPSATASIGCGSIGAPCRTIAGGLVVAKTQGLTIMYLDEGTYAEQVSLRDGLTIEGGWLYNGNGVWNAVCPGGSTDPSALAVIQPVAIATGPAAAVLADGVTATLSTLTVKSLATAAAGQTLYGVFASNDAKLTMTAVEVSVAAGGAGAPGDTEPAPAGPQPPCPPSDGNAATTPGTNGEPTAPTYAITGYVPGAGGAGTPGGSGDDGTAPGAGSCMTSICGGTSAAPTCTNEACSSPDAGPPGGDGQNCGCSAAGTSGCGGPGGAAGSGGGGGGSSVALYVFGATVEVAAGSLAAGDGGNGGAGGAGGTSPTLWTNGAGAPGAGAMFNECEVKMVCVPPNPCSNVCAYGAQAAIDGGTAGGAGGQGSAGGDGASGSGGDSYAYYAGGGGVVAVTGTSLTCGSGGTSPPPVAGASGANGSGSCH